MALEPPKKIFTLIQSGQCEYLFFMGKSVTFHSLARLVA